MISTAEDATNSKLSIAYDIKELDGRGPTETAKQVQDTKHPLLPVCSPASCLHGSAAGLD
jgi:hypothetical protein